MKKYKFNRKWTKYMKAEYVVTLSFVGDHDRTKKDGERGGAGRGRNGKVKEKVNLTYSYCWLSPVVVKKPENCHRIKGWPWNKYCAMPIESDRVWWGWLFLNERQRGGGQTWMKGHKMVVSHTAHEPYHQYLSRGWDRDTHIHTFIWARIQLTTYLPTPPPTASFYSLQCISSFSVKRLYAPWRWSQFMSDAPTWWNMSMDHTSR